MLRRLAALPERGLGLVVCDRAGSFVFRKPAEGFTMPRFGSACALWPVYEAFCAPGQVLYRRTAHLGRARAYFDTYAVAEAAGQAGYNTIPLLQSTMLIVPLSSDKIEASAPDIHEIGATCRICPREPCPGRREPSILS